MNTVINGPLNEAFDKYYATPRAQHLANEIELFLSQSWGQSDLSQYHVLCVGYPALADSSLFLTGASYALMTPRFIGGKKLLNGRHNASFVGDEAHMPIQKASYDRLLILHVLENSDDPISFLEETWKILSPGGKLFLMVPNKKGAWKKSGIPRTPSTRGFLFRDIKKMLLSSGFEVTGAYGVSYGLPVDFFGKVLFSGFLKTLSGGGTVGFPGFLIFEAEKIMTQGVCRPARKLKASQAKPVAS